MPAGGPPRISGARRSDRNQTLSQQLGTNVYLKYELFQKTGSFKPRGAFNQVLQLSQAQKDKGVVAVSGGNFAQAVAYAGQVLGIHTHDHHASLYAK